MYVESPRNPRIRRLRQLQQRRHRQRLGATLVEGRRFVAEALASGRPLRQVIYTEALEAHPEGAPLLRQLAAAGVPLIQVPEDLLARVAVTETPQGIVAEVAVEELAPAGEAWWRRVVSAAVPVALLADAVQDPGNLGTIIRAVQALGAAGVVLGPGTVDPYHPRVVRASAAACLRVPLARAGLPVWVADAGGQLPCWHVDWRRPALLVVGNEGAGVDPQVRRLATATVAIPMVEGVGSLNVAMAATVLLYEALRQQRR